MFKKIALVALLTMPVTAWAFVKPLHVLAPELVGLTCRGKICVDDLARLPEATALYNEAVHFAEVNVGTFQNIPRGVFCSTRACSKSYGFTYDGAYNVGTSGFVISYRGWQPYFVRHELIHHLQNEHIGSLKAWLFKPNWFKEGMAYSLSQDPRQPLPALLQGYRTEFETWSKCIDFGRIWIEADRL